MDNKPKLKPIDKDTVIYARPDGTCYHLNRECEMLAGDSFERLYYTTISNIVVKRRRLKPCFCAYEDYRPHKLAGVK